MADPLAPRIDHTLLDPGAGAAAIDRLCDEAIALGFATVCVQPVWVERCVGRLRGSPVQVCAVAGFPSGAHLAEVKALEACRATEHGASEIDVPIWRGALGDGRTDLVAAEIAAVVRACAPARVKAILETALLTPDEIAIAARLCVEAGAAFVKTSTGVAGGATVEVVRLLRRTVGPAIGVKASGGIRTRAQALALLEAGATRLGTSAGVAIVGEAERPG